MSKWQGKNSSCGLGQSRGFSVLVLGGRSLLGTRDGASSCASLWPLTGRGSSGLTQFSTRSMITSAQDAVWPTVEAILEGWSISPGANWERSERQGRSHSFIHSLIQDVHTYIHAHTQPSVYQSRC